MGARRQQQLRAARRWLHLRERSALLHRLVSCLTVAIFSLGSPTLLSSHQACADKLNREIATYGCPPNFPEEDETVADAPLLDAAGGVEQVGCCVVCPCCVHAR